jgi:uncharacterized OsmC-like protein
VKITLTSDESVRLEPTPGPMTIEAPSAERSFSPFHMLGSSLAYCTHSILVSWASNAGIGTDGLAIDVAWGFAEQPHRVGELRVTIDWPELPPNRRATAQRVATLCPIHATLTHSPSIVISNREGAPQAAGASASSGAPVTDAAGVS